MTQDYFWITTVWRLCTKVFVCGTGTAKYLHGLKAVSANGLENAYKSQTFKNDELIGPRYKCLEEISELFGIYVTFFLKLFIIYHKYVFCDTRNIGSVIFAFFF